MLKSALVERTVREDPLAFLQFVLVELSLELEIDIHTVMNAAMSAIAAYSHLSLGDDVGAFSVLSSSDPFS